MRIEDVFRHFAYFQSLSVQPPDEPGSAISKLCSDGGRGRGRSRSREMLVSSVQFYRVGG